MKVLAYGVRGSWITNFRTSKQKFGYWINMYSRILKFRKKLLAKQKVSKLLSYVVTARANKETLDIYKELGVEYVLTRTVGVKPSMLNTQNH